MSRSRSQNAKPLVSVVIPTYNRAGYVAECIESVLAQTYTNLEIIVIDDGSTDNTAEAVAPFEGRIRYIQQANSERGASRNHGLKLATGSYIAFLDSDDLWLPGKVEEAVTFMEAHPSVGLVYTDTLQVDSNGRKLKVVQAGGPEGRVTDDLLLSNFVSIGAHLARTSIVRDIGGFREERQLSGSEDWEMWIRLSLKTDFAYLPSATTKVRVHPANTMADAAAMQRSMAEAVSVLRASQLLSDPQKGMLDRTEAKMNLVNAINHCSNGQKAETLKFLRRAFANNPRIILDLRFPYTIFRLLIRK